LETSFESFKTNIMRKISYLLFAVALMFTCSNAFSQSFVIVMKAMDGPTQLNGGSALKGHENEIELLSYSQGEKMCAGCLKPALSDYNFTTEMSACTISFKRLLLTGKKLTSVDIVYMSQASTPFVFFKIHMEKVLVSSEQDGGSTGSYYGPTVSVSFTADKISWQRIAQNPDGSAGTKLTYGWDVVNNLPWTYVFP